ncbi:hypothetical protein PVK06_023377 [Gossypium arboreum]|uniref:RNase H type-1 domain-containing protein n=1 Tax=Gossypium arboreum TaxID=29729 RepID=A0ABR0PB94_GOSAR|nr:hypothetical protein PVK06_023377 [Gossypium arboreum]
MTELLSPQILSKSSNAELDGIVSNSKGNRSATVFWTCCSWGVARNKEGNWIVGYHQFLSKCSVFDAELWVILDDLKVVQRRGYDQVIIHFDSLEVVKSILGSSSTVSNSALMRRIHNIFISRKSVVSAVYSEGPKSSCGLFS